LCFAGSGSDLRCDAFLRRRGDHPTTRGPGRDRSSQYGLTTEHKHATSDYCTDYCADRPSSDESPVNPTTHPAPDRSAYSGSDRSAAAPAFSPTHGDKPCAARIDGACGRYDDRRLKLHYHRYLRVWTECGRGTHAKDREFVGNGVVVLDRRRDHDVRDLARRCRMHIAVGPASNRTCDVRCSVGERGPGRPVPLHTRV